MARCFVGDIDSSARAVERLAAKLAKRHRQLVFCYEAGPTGYGLHRQITGLGHDCPVVAPSLIPKRPGERVKTNRRDALTLAKLHRAQCGCQIQGTKQCENSCAREKLQWKTCGAPGSTCNPSCCATAGSSPVARRGPRHIQDGCASFDHPAQHLVLAEYRQAIEAAETRLERRTGQVTETVGSCSMAPLIAAYQALRGVAFLTAVTFVAEIGEVRRFDNPRQLMANLGLVPSRTRPANGFDAAASPRRAIVERAECSSRAPQVRLCGRYRRLMANGKRQTVVTVAIAREMSAFLWAIGQEVMPHLAD